QTLERNFRSDPAVIDWVNQAFRNMFPRHEDMLEGAIPYSQAKAMRTDGGSVHLHLQARRDDEAEASAVIAMVQQALQQGHSTGILARSRKHLHHIMDALQQANIPFRAIKILPLHEQPEIRALVALTRALLHPQDRVAWAGVLRSPCCGLSTQDLFSLPGDSETSPWQQLKQSQQMQLTTGHAQQARIAHVVQALDPCIGLAGKIAVRTLVKTAWQRLGMPGTLLPEQQTNVGNVLDLLDQLDGQPVHGEIDFALLDEHLAKRFTEPDSSPQANMVELLTMHGAKGLEWDTVILPGLGKDPGNSASPLLAFTEASAQTQSLFLMSPKSQTRSNDTLYNFIRRIEKARDTHETRRLLYVACTRARKTLHLCGHLNKAEEAARSSLLHLLLSQDETAFGATLHNIEATAASATNIRPLTRMAELPACLEATTAPASTASEIEYIWSGPTATAVGHAVHACLQQIGEQGIEQWQSSDSDAAINHMHRSLMREGLSGTLLEQAMQRCTRAINNTLSSSHGQWILSGQHQHARCEWPLSKRQHQQIRHFILDRSFIDEHGTRWIIDYKVSDHEGGNLESFIASEADRYSPQIRAYGALLGDLEPGRDIKQAIYFPLMDYLYVYPALG
ncbi:MAG: DNA helicase UvrD, partial [Zetaproteobacteria bacterium CG02_land_8_20_14_3_00_50_9]